VSSPPLGGTRSLPRGPRARNTVPTRTGVGGRTPVR